MDIKLKNNLNPVTWRNVAKKVRQQYTSRKYKSDALGIVCKRRQDGPLTQNGTRQIAFMCFLYGYASLKQDSKAYIALKIFSWPEMFYIANVKCMRPQHCRILIFSEKSILILLRILFVCFYAGGNLENYGILKSISPQKGTLSLNNTVCILFW